jgi:hypothetical protein
MAIRLGLGSMVVILCRITHKVAVDSHSLITIDSTSSKVKLFDSRTSMILLLRHVEKYFCYLAHAALSKEREEIMEMCLPRLCKVDGENVGFSRCHGREQRTKQRAETSQHSCTRYRIKYSIAQGRRISQGT